ncbi:replication factor C subunit 1 [Agrilus planipennis]|uniref:Replication factor C subunit 1 n=1 Tax=Agrilus planipennis TaxID=224129 RepID=A0A1W4X1X5_AGRPL|nr:replication factor C subunit 1 [Agrilus planipennis]
MPYDIRSYFNAAASKSKSAVKAKPKIPIEVSSDEDVISETPAKVKVKLTNLKKRKVILSDSDSDRESKKNTKRSKTANDNPGIELKKVNVEDILGSTPVKQSEVKIKPKNEEEIAANVSQSKKTPKKKLKTEVGIHNDEDFEKSLLELDEDFLLNNVDELDKTIELEFNKTQEELTTGNLKIDKDEKDIKTPGKRKKSPAKPKKSPFKNTHVETDQDRYDRKVHSAVSYQNYLHRGGPPHHGSKELPKGKPDCLRNLCFLRTGVLDSLESYEFEELIKEHGGRVVHAVSKKVNYVVMGDVPGPAKLEKARSYGIPIISEDDLLNLIQIKSGMKPTYTTSESEDLQNIEEEGQSSTKSPKEDGSPKQLNKEKSDLPERKIVFKTLEKDHSTKESLIEEEVMKETTEADKFPKMKRCLTPKKDHSDKEGSNEKLIKEEAYLDQNDDQIELSKASPEYETLLLTEKYKPLNAKVVVGQQGDHSNLKKLMTWLQNWHTNNQHCQNKSRNVKATSRNEPGASFKAALLSGPPGVGKTTTATLVAKELGFDVVEFNASDTRNKKLLHEEVSQLLSTKTIAGFVKDGSQPTSKRVLLMDEVDGMAGNEDRGGIQELVNLIKNTHIPIICMCNDRNHQKIRSLANYCFDLRFHRPRLEQIRAFLMTVCFRENLNVSPNALNEIITGAGMDIRQCLNNLAMWVAGEKSLSVEIAKKEATLAKKDTILGPWDVCKKIFNKRDHEMMSVTERGRLFFYDYSMAPLFVQENYLQIVPLNLRKRWILRASKTADSLSFADLLDKKIRSDNNWSLLEVESMFVAVIPGTYMGGQLGAQINFPSWLGKNSKRNKFQRIATEIQAHMRTSTSASRLSFNLDYASHLRNRILEPLIKKGMDGIQEAIDIMHAYKLSRDDLDGILELAHWHGSTDPSNQLNSKVKAAFTRQFKKEGVVLPYAATSASVKKRGVAYSEDLLNGEDEFVEDDDDEGEDDVTKDSNIKVKKATQKVVKKKDEASSSGTSKGGGKGKKKK